MKILITAPSLDTNENVSGISSVVRQIIDRSKADFSHFIAGRKDNKNLGVSWIFNQTSLIPRFIIKLRQEKPDILHLNTALTPLSISRDLALARIAKTMNVPIFLHLHGGKFLTQGFDSKLFKWLTEKMLRLSRVVVVLSEIEKNVIEGHWQNLDIRVLQNAVPLDDAKKRTEEHKEKTIIFLGRLHESKGLHEIIEACRILKSENYKFHFKCFGTGPLRDIFVDEMQKSLGIGFYYGGIISGAEKWKELAEADIFFLPSRYGEGLPMALLEAMAAGCIPIVSNDGSMGDVVEDGVNGFMVEPQNVPQIVNKLKLLFNEKMDEKMLRRNAQNRIKESFDLKNYIKKLEYIYSEIAD